MKRAVSAIAEAARFLTDSFKLGEMLILVIQFKWHSEGDFVLLTNRIRYVQ
ncbi:hypothetical protein SDC9_119819 [bioreactor metagenome]|uniref:Uncharacterized protein n=1 Tax=bioreactor metagenome TaxID=1076179 RepID=A0A645C8Y0_9ZZZZ